MTFLYRVDSVTFSDGTRIEIAEDEVVVFVGPNNAGKSQALRDIRGVCANAKDQRPVVTAVSTVRSGSLQDLLDWFGPYVHEVGDGYDRKYVTAFGEVSTKYIEEKLADPNGIGFVARMVIVVAKTDDRLSITEPRSLYDGMKAAPDHALHELYDNEGLEWRLNDVFGQAFHADLVVDRRLGKYVSLRCGQRPTEADPTEHARMVKLLPYLHEQGDGMRSFVGCLLYVVVGRCSVLLLDEPEAFLHPPQARLLGRMLVEKSSPPKQLFVATHSGDVVRGLLDSATERLSIVRIERVGDTNVPRRLDATALSKAWRDPSLRFSNILDGIFHELVIICEGDSDCRFYSWILDALVSASTERRPAIMFTSSGGKQRLPSLTSALASLGVAVIAIADFDILSERQPLQALYESLGGKWGEIERGWKIVVSGVASKKRPRATEVQQQISDILNEDVSQSGELSLIGAENIASVIRSVSPWKELKRSGEHGLTSGQVTEAGIQLLDLLAARGLFVVRCGELERFVPDVGSKGEAWLSEVLQRDPLKHASLAAAREFVTKILAYQRTASLAHRIANERARDENVGATDPKSVARLRAPTAQVAQPAPEMAPQAEKSTSWEERLYRPLMVALAICVLLVAVAFIAAGVASRVVRDSMRPAGSALAPSASSR